MTAVDVVVVGGGLAGLTAANRALQKGLSAVVVNEAVESGNLDALNPTRTPGRLFGVLRSSETHTSILPIKQPPFYAIRLCPGITYAMGGIAIDPQARVLGTNDAPISGLYAAGACTGGLEGGPLAGYIGGLCKALSLGYIAAESIGSDAMVHA